MNNLVKYGALKEHFDESYSTGLFLGRVVSQYKDIYKVVTEEGVGLAEVSGRFIYEALALKDYPAVGDFILVDRPDDLSGNMIISKVLKRKSFFERKAPGHGKEMQIVATNIDIVFICMSLNNDFNLNRLERYIVAAFNSGGKPIVILTKADLCNDLEDILNEVSDISLGVDVIPISVFDDVSLNKLAGYIKPGVTTTFIGSSGVGKTTLINKLLGEDLLLTDEIRNDDKGKHTTTRRELILLPSGGLVIDTPGMRELGVEYVSITESFEDIEELALSCKFKNCTHGVEPGCKIREALYNGELDERRYANYLKLKKESKYEDLDFKELEKTKFDDMFKEFGGIKKIKKYKKNRNKL